MLFTCTYDKNPISMRWIHHTDLFLLESSTTLRLKKKKFYTIFLPFWFDLAESKYIFALNKTPR